MRWLRSLPHRAFDDRGGRARDPPEKRAAPRRKSARDVIGPPAGVAHEAAAEARAARDGERDRASGARMIARSISRAQLRRHPFVGVEREHPVAARRGRARGSSAAPGPASRRLVTRWRRARGRSRAVRSVLPESITTISSAHATDSRQRRMTRLLVLGDDDDGQLHVGRGRARRIVIRRRGRAVSHAYSRPSVWSSRNELNRQPIADRQHERAREVALERRGEPRRRRRHCSDRKATAGRRGRRRRSARRCAGTRCAGCASRPLRCPRTRSA